jgi:hypothetical protein
MATAYREVSSNGTLPAQARQIYYAARRPILKETGEHSLNSNYFTQRLLPDYIAEHPEAQGWDVVFDARGHLQEPHTELIVPLGTLDVRKYVSDTKRHALPEISSLFSGLKTERFPTHGPVNRFSALVFIEKEGFLPLFKAVNLAQKWDIAIMSSKGMPVVACRHLADEICGAYEIPLLLLHDFDKAGFSMVGTFQGVEKYDGNYNLLAPRYEYRHDFEIVDLGIRLPDVDACGLESEPVSYRGKSNPSGNLESNGATPEEIKFLVSGGGRFMGYHGDRVELNAFTSQALVDWIEGKLQEHGIKKVIPDDKTLKTAYRRAMQIQYISARVDDLLDEAAEEADKASIPKNLKAKIRKRLKADPTKSWDGALFSIAEEAD